MCQKRPSVNQTMFKRDLLHINRDLSYIKRDLLHHTLNVHMVLEHFLFVSLCPKLLVYSQTQTHSQTQTEKRGSNIVNICRIVHNTFSRQLCYHPTAPTHTSTTTTTPTVCHAAGFRVLVIFVSTKKHMLSPALRSLPRLTTPTTTRNSARRICHASIACNTQCYCHN